MSYDYFAAALKCSQCDAISPADTSTNMQTYLQELGTHAVLCVGAPIALDPERVLRSQYDGYFYSGVAIVGAIRILQPWECPACGYAPNWAQVEVAERHIARIDAVQFDRKSVFSSHLISNEAKPVAALLANISVRDAFSRDVMTIFAKCL